MELTKMIQCGKRIYNSVMIEEKDEAGVIKYTDADAIKALCEKVFTKDGRVKNIEDLRSFNALIVDVAEEMAKPKLQPILDAVSNYSQVGRYDKKVYEVPKKSRVHTALSATATGVDFTRITPGVTRTTAKAEQHQFGVEYNVEKMISDPVNEFRNAVDYVMEYKVKYVFGKVMALARTGFSLGKIPTAQNIDTANITLAQFKAVENRMLRYGNRVAPVLIADVNLIDSLASKQSTLVTTNDIITDALKTEMLREINVSKISRSIAIPTDNPFTDNMNSKVDLPVNEGIMLAGGDKSPFYITEFGGMRTTDGIPNIEDEIVRMKVDFRMDITLLYGQAMAYLRDTSVVL
jgi:hypothetical protein